jgi:thioredoxin-like negative regulator of GroEL
MRIAMMLCLAGLLANVLPAQTDERPEASEKPEAAPKISWERDYKAAVKKSAESKKPMLIDLYTDWCYWCKVMDEKVWSDDAVAKRVADEYVPVKIDCEADTETAEKFEAAAFPTYVIADAEGKVLVRFEGAFATEAAPALEWLTKVSVALKARPELEAKFDESKHCDVEAGEKLAATYRDLNDMVRVAWVYEELLSARNEGETGLLEVRFKAAKAQLEAGEAGKSAEHAKILEGKISKDHALHFDFRMFQADLALASQQPAEFRKIADELREKLLTAKDERIFNMTDNYIYSFLGEEDDEKVTVEAFKKGRELYLGVAKVFEGDRKLEARAKAAYYGYHSGDKETGKKEMKEIADMEIESPWVATATAQLVQWATEESGGEERMDG